MNKYITPLTENEVLAWQNDCLNPENRFIPVSLQETQGNMAFLFYGFWRFLFYGFGGFIYPCWSLSLGLRSLFSLLRKTSKFEEYGRTNKNRSEVAPWKTNFIK